VTDRQIDWRGFLNKLIYCYGCGQFRMPRKGVRPKGWTMLYQPHAEGPPGLTVCSEGCADDVREAMERGPVEMPLRAATNITMSTEMRETMLEEAVQFGIDEGHMDDLFHAAMKEEESDA
jgi:hypothetical protein